MPAKKPLDLHTRHATKAERAKRADDESSLRSKQEVPVSIPEQLRGNKVAKSTWHRLVKEYNRLEAKIVSRLDMDLLIDYCVEVAQLDEIDRLRALAKDLQQNYDKRRLELIKENDAAGVVLVANQMADMFDKILKLDGRADRKRDLLLKMRQSLYMTPRARAGTAPADRKPPEVEDPFETALKKAAARINDRSGDAQ